MARRTFKNAVLPVALTYLGLAVGLIFAGFPILWMFFTSLKSNTEIFALPPRLLPNHITVEAYLSIFNDPAKVQFFINIPGFLCVNLEHQRAVADTMSLCNQILTIKNIDTGIFFIYRRQILSLDQFFRVVIDGIAMQVV